MIAAFKYLKVCHLEDVLDLYFTQGVEQHKEWGVAIAEKQI